MKKYKLGIICPTHYKKMENYAAILNIMTAAENHPEKIKVIISDNSNCKKKLNFLRDISSHLNNIEILQGPIKHNHAFALAHANTEFSLFSGDDDNLLSRYLGEALNVIEKEECTAIIGKMGSFYKQGCNFFDYKLLDTNNLEEKIHGYINGNPRGNLLFHGIYKTELLQEAVKIWLSIPNFQSYHDHIMTLFLASQGAWKIIESPYFIYNMQNWDTIEDRIKSEIKYLKILQLPASLVLLQRFMLAIEGCALLQKIHENQSNHASSIWFLEWFNLWKTSLGEGYLENKEVINCKYFSEVIKIVENLISKSEINLSEAFITISLLYSKINGSGKNYISYWLEKKQV